MDLVKSMQNYINKMVTDVTGLKVLLLDSETISFVSVVLTQSQLLAKEVYLINRIDQKNREKMKHMKCVCFIRPSQDSLQALVEELRNPLYGEYHLCKHVPVRIFTNVLKKSQVERLAEVDDFEVVKEVQEYFGDFLALDSDLFSLNLTFPQRPVYGETPNTWEGNAFQRSIEGLISVLLALKKRPMIRYAKNSAMAKRLATELHYQIQQESQLFDFRKPDTPPILLILDRKNDPVTPLLNQWTYQAMVHELLGINNGRVDMSSAADTRPELKEIVLSADHDPFYKKNMFLNLGDLGANIKSYVEEYQTKTKSNMKINSIAEMKRFIEEYPEFRKLSGNVSKHVTLVGELSRVVEKGSLLEVGELEQNLACVEQHSLDFATLQTLIGKANVPVLNKVKLVVLYALRYEKSASNNLSQLIDLLSKHGVEHRLLNYVASVIRFGGADQRQDDVFSNESFLSKSKSVFRGLQGVENIYTQHMPYLAQILGDLYKSRLKDTAYPFIEGSTRDRPQDVIVFMIGGSTYAEARTVTQFMTSTPGARIVLGGTHVHNSVSFLREVSEASSRWTSNSVLGSSLK